MQTRLGMLQTVITTVLLTETKSQQELTSRILILMVTATWTEQIQIHLITVSTQQTKFQRTQMQLGMLRIVIMTAQPTETKSLQVQTSRTLIRMVMEI